GALLSEAGDPDAELWFERAARAGHVEARFNHARALLDSDPVAARDWYGQAGKAGFGPASFNLSLMLARGQGGARSFQKALTWALVAQEQGFVQAATLIGALSEVMSAEAEGTARAQAGLCLADVTACPDG
ncbi:MAG: hypothetical protein GVY34_13600, partial [Alphaproteobacteria bacterium]|nr:hypothetical protein [Alphaproteobacteria bacterium]